MNIARSNPGWQVKAMRVFTILLFAISAFAHEVDTNNVYMGDAPDWVSRNRVEKVVAHIQTLLEWDIRKVTVSWYKDEAKFESAHNLGANMLAVSIKNSNTIHLGPRVTNANFDQVFGHELVHIISYQKYKGAIPQWLEEGLANHLAKNANVDYHWLAGEPFPSDVRGFVHPASGSADEIHYHYVTSQALIEMIAKKCDLTNLLRLSVGEKMDTYLETYCEIPDLNVAYQKWVKSKAGVH
jgi:hypothetical protein